MKLRPDEIEGLIRDLFNVNESLSRGYQLRIGRHGSLAIDCERGRYFDHEGGIGGGLVDAVVLSGEVNSTEDARRLIADRVWRGADHAPNRSKTSVDKAAMRANARRLWDEACAISGTPVERYLARRKIRATGSLALRYLPRAWNAEVSSFLPAMLAAVTRLDQPAVVVAVHRTWVTSAGQKAGLKSPKKALGSTSGGGVVLASVEDAVVVGEGIETTLSASAVLGLPGIAALGTSGMMRLDLPERIKRVVIAYDRDANGAGRRAAQVLAQRLLAHGCRVDLAGPPEGFNDFNEWAQAAANEGRGNA